MGGEASEIPGAPRPACALNNKKEHGAVPSPQNKKGAAVLHSYKKRRETKNAQAF
jgi:hypothetical protein